MAIENDAPNEIVAETREVTARRKAAEKAADATGRNWPLVGLGVGIGSAAIAAAVLYANRNRKHDD